MNIQKLKKFFKVLLHKPKLLLLLVKGKKYTIAELITLKQLLSESIKKDNTLFHENQPSHKKFTNEELFAMAAKVYDIEERMSVKQNDLQQVTLDILKFNVKSNNNKTIQELSACTRELENLKKTRKKGKHSYSYTPFYKKLKIEQRIQKLMQKEQVLKEKLTKINNSNFSKMKLSRYSKALLSGNKLPF